MTDVRPVLDFLRCRTPDAWVGWAIEDIPTLLLDHAGLELKAAQQAQKLIRRYAVVPLGSPRRPGASRAELLRTLSRLAREELRHFEQVVGILERRGIDFRPVSASRYAAALHGQVRDHEPARLTDTLIVGAIIEARSCERFHRLVAHLERPEPELAKFYGSLLRSESRHFQDYLRLAERLACEPIEPRLELFLEQERCLIVSGDETMRFHSGVPA